MMFFPIRGNEESMTGLWPLKNASLMLRLETEMDADHNGGAVRAGHTVPLIFARTDHRQRREIPLS
jgi:hypothetical protein